MNGGRRPGTGRKRGGRNAAQLKIIDIAGQVLHEIDAKEKWKALLNCSDPKVMVNVMEYLHRSYTLPSNQRGCGDGTGIDKIEPGMPSTVSVKWLGQ